MADALVSPGVGGAMWVATAATLAVSARRVTSEMDERKIPLMGVLGAFIFAAQMVNFTIPGTGSSGHLGGGVILAVLLGPFAALLVMASILTVQALFFADGGLLALGCNILNLGVFPAFVAYPLLFKPIAGERPTAGRLTVASLVASVGGLQLGAFGVVGETVLSGVSELPFSAFAIVMQPIHLAIGVVEGVITAAVIAFIWKARPEVIQCAGSRRPIGPLPLKPLLTALAIGALLIGGVLSWFASSRPDGLEWAVEKVSGGVGIGGAGGRHEMLAQVQEETALLPDYGFKGSAGTPGEGGGHPAWPAADPGTSLAGVLGGGIVLVVALLLALALYRRKPGGNA